MIPAVEELLIVVHADQFAPAGLGITRVDGIVQIADCFGDNRELIIRQSRKRFEELLERVAVDDLAERLINFDPRMRRFEDDALSIAGDTEPRNEAIACEQLDGFRKRALRNPQTFGDAVHVGVVVLVLDDIFQHLPFLLGKKNPRINFAF